ncbi:hypothetical protein AKJ61_04760 [candidate division MSBL1 archaeon SCGC-AAA259B11]|uniref:Transcription factor CBF/NF-Y/archaeal histone domain-containing protein n=1 Tax=candidate division MSBL1 archaeon SCGC-AAA259B11 TaxID=1698260 RepID=A0A133U2U7_9EURY|nr:hypothetical protein AKJ61_04760 [candidate division MSBL1 archaeon SCGC-AAA259B11]
MAELPLAAVDRVIRKAGADRVSESASVRLSKVLEKKALEIASEATKARLRVLELPHRSFLYLLIA